MSEHDATDPGFHHVPRPEGRRPRKPLEPFPLEVLPASVVEMVKAVAASRCISADVPAALALSACASAMGMSRIAYDDFADWSEPPIIWLVVVVRSGSRKTIVFEDLFAPHKERQQRLAEEFESKLAAYNQELEEWRQRTRKSKSLEVEPKPQAPRLEHVYTADATPEGLLEILRFADRGVLILVDELAHFFGGLGAYTGKAERDRAFYLALFRGIQVKSDRKGSGSTFVAQAAAHIAGGIQPRILKKCFDDASYASGMVSRFLIVDAAPQIKQYRQGPTVEEKERYSKFIQKLFELGMEPYSRADGEIGYRPQRVPLSTEARELLKGFVPDWSEESLLENADVEAAMSKLEGYALRFALILRICREVEGLAQPEDPISRSDLENGIRLARWFRDRAISIYGELRTEDEATPQSTLLSRAEVIRRRFDGAVTVREWHKRNTRRTPEEAEKELAELVDACMAIWRERPAGPKGGRPSTECALIDLGDGGQDNPGGGEVSGCGLRVAQESVQDEIGPQKAGEGGEVTPLAEGCNPKPSVVEELLLSETPATDGSSQPGTSSEGLEGGGAQAGPAQRDEGHATRNPQPITPSDSPGAGFPGSRRPRPQPETPLLPGMEELPGWEPRP